jgi:hypothetical protein
MVSYDPSKHAGLLAEGGKVHVIADAVQADLPSIPLDGRQRIAQETELRIQLLLRSRPGAILQSDLSDEETRAQVEGMRRGIELLQLPKIERA